MTLDVGQSIALLVIALISIIILLRILTVVHGQNGRMKELEMRMKAVENMDSNTKVEEMETKES